MDPDKRRKELEQRLCLTQDRNERMVSMIEATKKMIQRARLERALLLEKLESLQSRGDELELSPPASPAPDAVKQEGSPAGDTTPQPGAQLVPLAKKPALKLPNAYNVFCREQRDATIELLRLQGHKSPKAQVVQRTLSDQWKGYSKDQKKPYSEKARQIKETQKREQDEFDEADPADGGDGGDADEPELDTFDRDQSDYDQQDSQMEL